MVGAIKEMSGVSSNVEISAAGVEIEESTWLEPKITGHLFPPYVRDRVRNKRKTRAAASYFNFKPG